MAMWGNKFRARVVFGQRVARLSSHPSPELALVVEECARVQSDTAISDDMSCHCRLAHSADRFLTPHGVMAVGWRIAGTADV